MITVGMPVFNGERTIAGTLESLLAQTYENLNIMISDNASTDATGEICNRYARLDPRITYLRNEISIGVVANFNKVLEMCDTPFFMWAAADDLWEPDFMKEMVGLLERDPSAVLAFSRCDIEDRISGKRSEWSRLGPLGRPGGVLRRQARFLLVREGGAKTCMILGVFRTPALKRVRGLHPETDDGIWAVDAHALFLLGFAGTYAISEKVLFHKGFEPIRNPDEIVLPTIRQIGKGYRVYREEIASSGMSSFARGLLHTCALYNYTRSLGGNLAEKALIRCQGVPLARRLYQRLFPKYDPL